jgi:catechol 2,3-dioxygenase-like lactoylglutathione lyase family enzyme
VVDLTEPLGPRHVALKVDNIEDEQHRITELMKNINFNPIFDTISSDWTGERYVFFHDPDGNVVELHE